ncbi:MAG: conjugal transfer protein TraI, partial [Proteobacteria bacterium]
DDPEIAVLEILATQNLNSRSKADKTYHLIVSFPEDERPDVKTLKIIEETLCNSLGYSEHQRLTAVHRDSTHLHMHIAISRIHPVTFNNYEPFRDFQKLQTAARELELKHGLTTLKPQNIIAQKQVRFGTAMKAMNPGSRKRSLRYP